MLLEGEKVRLREFRREDATAIREWINNENINRYLGFWLAPQSAQETEAYVERQLTRQDSPPREIQFVIALKDDPDLRYIGSIGLHAIDYRNRNCELGIVIGREDLLGQGLGTDAIVTLLDYAFDFLNLHRVELVHHDYNERGHRCYLKCGFKEEGRLREKRFYDGRYWDVIIMGITEGEHRANRASRRRAKDHETGPHLG